MNNSGGIGAPLGDRRTLGPRRHSGRLGAKSSARRCLFGPVDHQETDDFFEEFSRQLDEQKKEQWGFDFKAGRPVLGVHPVYEWVAVEASDDIPSAYGRMAQSWRDPGLVRWANENEDLRRVSPNSHRSNDRSRKRLRSLSPDSPHLDSALAPECSTAEDPPDRGPNEASSGSSVRLEATESRSNNGPPLNDPRKLEEKVEKYSGSRPPDIPGFPEGSGRSSVVCTKDAQVPSDFPTGTEDDDALESPSPGCRAMPEKK